jgi:hypothetical protein
VACRSALTIAAETWRDAEASPVTLESMWRSFMVAPPLLIWRLHNYLWNDAGIRGRFRNGLFRHVNEEPACAISMT